MARLLIVVLCFVGLAAALPTLNLKNERAKRALDILKQGNFNRLTSRAMKKEDTLEGLTEELENLLKRGGGQGNEGGQTRVDDSQGQGQQHGQDKSQRSNPCADIPENPLENLENYNEFYHWMHFLCNLRTEDHSAAFNELIEQMEQATDILMETINECTDREVYTDEDLDSLKELAIEAYEAGKPGQGNWENLDEFDTDTKALFAKYHELEEKGMEAAYSSESWTPLCTDLVTDLDREVRMLNTASYMYKLWTGGWLEK